jgi:Cu-Zn family superoxide dismutase
VGSLADGTLYRLMPAGGVEQWSAAGQDGRTSVAGVKVDARGRLWAAGGYEGTLWFYDLVGRSLVARLDVGVRPSCVNDIAFGAGGEAYVTDSLTPWLFRVAGDPPTLEPWVDLASQGVPWPGGLNLNGIVVAPDARHLVTCQTNLGRFWRVSLASGTVAEVALEGGPLEHCDGLALTGSTLYVAVNARDRVAVVDLADDGASGRVRALLASDAFAFPTAIALAAGRLLVVNGQLNKMGGRPRLPFTVTVISAPEV